MTEQEWLACTDPTPMLDFLRAKTSDRKLRLFSIACCRRLWHLLDDDHGRPALEAAERCAEGWMSVDDLWALWKTNDLSFNYFLHEQIAQRIGVDRETVSAAFFAIGLTMGMTGWRQVTDSADGAAATAGRLGLGSRADEFAYEEQTEYEQAAGPFTSAEKVAQAMLLRDSFGNPFHPVTIAPAWQTANVVSLAQTIYDEKAFDRMPILGDALEDAGCDNAEMLQHCRQPGEHVRGCWVVDLVLGKE
ncbi:hypothetical protein AYO44_13665 [Planctomycetaceae bacterium SCGC AG-212-F19]|nr:hypothetical protein AYO44_13665 [Planctomycetaceae bacterium SCGC AG-212-F19]